MEFKQIFMLVVLSALAVIGSGVLIYILGSLDREDDGDQNKDSHGH